MEGKINTYECPNCGEIFELEVIAMVEGYKPLCPDCMPTDDD